MVESADMATSSHGGETKLTERPLLASLHCYVATSHHAHYCDCNQASPDNYHDQLIRGLGDQTRLLQRRHPARCLFWHAPLCTYQSC